MTSSTGPARRLAFVVPEWTTTEDDPGDQALVTERICVALLDAGWQPEVFAPADEIGTVDEDGIVVHRVARGHAPPGMPAAEWFERVVDKSILAAGLRKAMNNESLLASTRMAERRTLFAAQAQARLRSAPPLRPARRTRPTRPPSPPTSVPWACTCRPAAVGPTSYG